MIPKKITRPGAVAAWNRRNSRCVVGHSADAEKRTTLFPPSNAYADGILIFCFQVLNSSRCLQMGPGRGGCVKNSDTADVVNIAGSVQTTISCPGQE